MGRRIELLDGYGEAHKALRQNDVEWFRRRFEGKPDDINHNGLVAFLARANRPDLVKMMLDFGGDPDARDIHGNTAVAAAASVGSMEMLSWFIDRGAELFPQLPDKADQFHFFIPVTPLEQAVRGNHIEVARFLLEKGADPNQQFDRHSPSNVHVAVANNSREMVDLLLAAGAKFSRKKNKIAISVAARHGHIDLLDYLLERSKVRVDSPEGFKNGLHILTPLEEASQFGELDCVKLLIEKYQADPYASTIDGDGLALSPPLLALATGQAEVFTYFLSRGIDPWIESDYLWPAKSGFRSRFVEPGNLLFHALRRMENPNRDPFDLDKGIGYRDDERLVLLVTLLEMAAWSLDSCEMVFDPIIDSSDTSIWESSRPAYHYANVLYHFGKIEKARTTLSRYIQSLETAYEIELNKRKGPYAGTSYNLVECMKKDRRLLDARGLLRRIQVGEISTTDINELFALAEPFKGRCAGFEQKRLADEAASQVHLENLKKRLWADFVKRKQTAKNETGEAHEESEKLSERVVPAIVFVTMSAALLGWILWTLSRSILDGRPESGPGWFVIPATVLALFGGVLLQAGIDVMVGRFSNDTRALISSPIYHFLGALFLVPGAWMVLEGSISGLLPAVVGMLMVIRGYFRQTKSGDL